MDAVLASADLLPALVFVVAVGGILIAQHMAFEGVRVGKRAVKRA